MLNAVYKSKGQAASDLRAALKLKMRRRARCYPYRGEDRDLEFALERLQTLNGREMVELLDWMRLEIFAGR